MSITAKFDGGPLDGQTREIQTITPSIHVDTPAPGGGVARYTLRRIDNENRVAYYGPTRAGGAPNDD